MGSWRSGANPYSFVSFEEPLEINTGVITALELSPDEKIVAIGTRDFVQFRDAKTLRLLRTYASATGGDKIHFGPNSQTILVGYKDEINVQSALLDGRTRVASPRSRRRRLRVFARWKAFGQSQRANHRDLDNCHARLQSRQAGRHGAQIENSENLVARRVAIAIFARWQNFGGWWFEQIAGTR